MADEAHKTFSIRIPTKLYDALEAAGTEEHRNRQSLIISAITLYLERRRVAQEGAAVFVEEFDRTKVREMTVDQTLQAAAKIPAPAAAPYDPANPTVTVKTPPRAGKS